MRCDSCNYLTWDYSENYETCSLGIESYENSKGSIGCKYRQKTLDRWSKQIEEQETEYYKNMVEAIEHVEGKPIEELI